jgi:hypothetical protein
MMLFYNNILVPPMLQFHIVLHSLRYSPLSGGGGDAKIEVCVKVVYLFLYELGFYRCLCIQGYKVYRGKAYRAKGLQGEGGDKIICII